MGCTWAGRGGLTWIHLLELAMHFFRCGLPSQDSSGAQALNTSLIPAENHVFLLPFSTLAATFAHHKHAVNTGLISEETKHLTQYIQKPPWKLRWEKENLSPHLGSAGTAPVPGWMQGVDHEAPAASWMLVLPPAQHQLFMKGNGNKTAWHLKRNHYHTLVANQSWSALKFHVPALN